MFAAPADTARTAEVLLAVAAVDRLPDLHPLLRIRLLPTPMPKRDLEPSSIRWRRWPLGMRYFSSYFALAAVELELAHCYYAAGLLALKLEPLDAVERGQLEVRRELMKQNFY